MSRLQNKIRKNNVFFMAECRNCGTVTVMAFYDTKKVPSDIKVTIRTTPCMNCNEELHYRKIEEEHYDRIIAKL